MSRRTFTGLKPKWQTHTNRSLLTPKEEKVDSQLIQEIKNEPSEMPQVLDEDGACDDIITFIYTDEIDPTSLIHPDVRLKKLAFYDVFRTLIQPTTLVPRNLERVQALPFNFTLTPHQAARLTASREKCNGTKIQPDIQVQLRFCVVETSGEQEDCFPDSVMVTINQKTVWLPKLFPSPLNITPYIKVSSTVKNEIMIQWRPDYMRHFCVVVYMVKRLPSRNLLHRLKKKGLLSKDYTLDLIKEKLTLNPDCEIATTMLRVSLNCPLGKMKMTLPCRDLNCSHLQCFDASLYLQMNEHKQTWKCPVCVRPVSYDNLQIDGYFFKVLNSSRLKSSVTEIQVHQDGSWSGTQKILKTTSKPIKIDSISDDVKPIVDEKPIKKEDQSISKLKCETIDLTLGESDDDDDNIPLSMWQKRLKLAQNAQIKTKAQETKTDRTSLTLKRYQRF